MLTIPAGKQHKIVVMIASAKWLEGIGGLVWLVSLRLDFYFYKINI